MATRDQIVKLLTAHPALTYQGIGEIVGRSRQRVHQVAMKAGLTKKSRLQRPDVTIERVLELYYGSNLFIRDIARVFSCNELTVRRRLRAAGISPSESHSRKMELYWSRLGKAARAAAK